MRVAILSNMPDMAGMLTKTLQRLGHDPVAAIAAKRKKPIPGLRSLDDDPTVPGTTVLVAERKDELEPMLRSLEPDVALSWGFPWRVPLGALNVPDYGSVNYHPALLPRHRGINSLAWAVRMGDSHFGATWHRMDSEFDTGPILAQRSTPASDDDTPFEVELRLCTLGLRMLRGVLERVAARDPGDPQPTEGASNADSFGEDYATIDWSMPARAVHDQVRAWAFTLGTNSVVGPIGELDGQKVRVLRTSLQQPEGEARRIECGDGPLWIVETEPFT